MLVIQAQSKIHLCPVAKLPGRALSLALLVIAVPMSSAQAKPVVISAAKDISAAVEQYRALLGANNGGEPGPKSGGRREINWDGVPDNLAAPNFLPPDFFNAPTAPRARGAMLTTPGKGVQASANKANAAGTPVRFGHINATYVDTFKAFSEERLFSPIGSNIVDLTFYVPGTKTVAVTRGFGAVYTDVDKPHTSFKYFDSQGQLLGKFKVPIANNGLSFLGVAYPKPIVARVRIEYGSAALGKNDGPKNDVSVMDDFIYGEPQAVQ